MTPGWCGGRRSHASPPGEACSHSAQILQLRAGATEKQQVVSGKDEVIFYLAAIKDVFVCVWVTHHDILFWINTFRVFVDMFSESQKSSSKLCRTDNSLSSQQDINCYWALILVPGARLWCSLDVIHTQTSGPPHVDIRDEGHRSHRMWCDNLGNKNSWARTMKCIHNISWYPLLKGKQ